MTSTATAIAFVFSLVVSGWGLLLVNCCFGMVVGMSIMSLIDQVGGLPVEARAFSFCKELMEFNDMHRKLVQ